MTDNVAPNDDRTGLDDAEASPRVSVIIPHYDDLPSLNACLDALALQTFAERFEIIVADNRSPCGLAAVEAVSQGRARVIDAPERGAGPARNAGVAASRGRLLAFTDCDCVPAPGWLEAGVAALAAYDVVGGAVSVSVGDERAMSGAEAFERVFAFDNRRYVKEERFSVTANLFCARQVFDLVGPFRAGVSEDIDWCHRAVAGGHTLGYAPRAIVAHPARRDWPQLQRKWRRITVERHALVTQRPGGRRRWAMRTAMLPLSIIGHGPRIWRSRRLPDGKTRLRALGTLARLRLWRTAYGFKRLIVEPKRLGEAAATPTSADATATGVMHVAVVIVGYRNTGDLVRCVAALDRADYADFRVAIVENGGHDAFRQDVAALPTVLSKGQPVQLIEASGNLGFAGGVNLGIRQTPDANAWWVLNPDALAAPDALSWMVARLAQGNCDAVGGVLHFADGTIQSLGGVWQTWIARAISIGADQRLDVPIDAPAIERQLAYLPGASMLIHRRFITLAGPMREDYFLYAEEVEWFLRGARSGARLGFAADARVLHDQGTTTGWSKRIAARAKLPTYLDERNRLLLTRDLFPLRFPIVALGSLAFMLARFGRKRAWRQIGYGLRGWLAAIAGERGPPRWFKSD